MTIAPGLWQNAGSWLAEPALFEQLPPAPSRSPGDPPREARLSVTPESVLQIVEASATKLEFQAEVHQLLDLMVHSLYKHKEIFLRELISNSSDALDRLRYLALTEPDLLAGDDELRIRLEPDTEARTLTIVDNGIGMSREEVIKNLGTIARSGTAQFAEVLKKAAAEGEEGVPELIGQFGVGFYSAFMVADEVTVETRRADGQGGAVRWHSDGTGSYTVEDIEREERGTRITLHLKQDEGDDAEDFTQEHVLRKVVRQYSDFVEYPIQMDVTRTEIERDDEGKEVEGAEKQEVTETVTLNSMKPLWTRPASDVTPEEHAEFYKHIAHDWQDPLETIHFKAEGATEYTALLYLPAQRPFDLFDPEGAKSKLSLYVRRVFITDDCEELLPNWLRFVKGLVDSADLPLNVSRETLQHTRQMKPIAKRLTKKVLDTLGRLLKDEREKYEDWWKAFGVVLKEGMFHSDENREAVAGLSLFETTNGDGLSTLDEYVGRMPVKQKAIYTIAGLDRKALEASPHLEKLAAEGFEVIFLTDQVDEFAMGRLTEFAGKPIQPVERGEVELDDDEEAKKEREEKSEELKSLLEAVQSELDEDVSEVRFSGRLTDSAAVLVTAEGAMSANQERILRAARQDVFHQKRVLELNADHPLVAKLETLREGDESRFGDYCQLILDQALLAEGSVVKDPARFGKLVTELMVGED